MDDLEYDRLIAVLQGSFMAKNFPEYWKKMQRAKMDTSYATPGTKLKIELEKKLK